MAHIKKVEYKGSPNIGLFFFATDSYVIGPEKIKDLDVLKVPFINVTIGGLPLAGIFCCGNTHNLVISKLIEERELKNLKEEIRNLDIDVNLHIFDNKNTAIGNLVVCNDKGAAISEKIKKDKKFFENALDVEVIESSKIGDSSLIGSYSVATNKGVLLCNECSEEEYQKICDVLKVEGDLCSVNFGSPFLRSGIIANSYGCLVGKETTGFEIARIDEILFLNKENQEE